MMSGAVGRTVLLRRLLPGHSRLPETPQHGVVAGRPFSSGCSSPRLPPPWKHLRSPAQPPGRTSPPGVLARPSLEPQGWAPSCSSLYASRGHQIAGFHRPRTPHVFLSDNQIHCLLPCPLPLRHSARGQRETLGCYQNLGPCSTLVLRSDSSSGFL